MMKYFNNNNANFNTVEELINEALEILNEI